MTELVYGTDDIQDIVKAGIKNADGTYHLRDYVRTDNGLLEVNKGDLLTPDGTNKDGKIMYSVYGHPSNYLSKDTCARS